MTSTSLSNGTNGRLLLIGGALPALLIGLLLVFAGLAFIPASQRPTSGVADLGPGFAFFFVLMLLPAGLLTVGLVVASRLPIRPLAILGGYGNLLFGVLWVALVLGFAAHEQQLLAGVMGALPGGLFIFTGLTGLAGWVQRGMAVPGWSVVSRVTIGLLVAAVLVGLVSGMMTRSSRVVLAEAGGPAVTGISWIPTSEQLLSGDENGRLQQWQNNTPTTVAKFETRIVEIAVSPQETAVAVSLPEQLLLLDPATWQTQLTLPLPADETPYTLQWSPDGKLLAGEISDKTLVVFAADTGNLVSTLQTDVGGIGQGFSWSPDSTKVAYAVGGGYIVVWDAVAGSEIANWRPNGRMSSIAWSPDGTKLAYNHITSVNLIDATTGNELAEYDLPFENDVDFLAWSPDGTKMAGGTVDGDVVVLDAENGRFLLNRSEHEKAITGLLWAPNGTQLATSSRDGQLIVWTIR